MLSKLDKNHIKNISGGFFYIDYKSGDDCILFVSDKEKKYLNFNLNVSFVGNLILPGCDFSVNSYKGSSKELDKLCRILMSKGFKPQAQLDFVENFWS